MILTVNCFSKKPAHLHSRRLVQKMMPLQQSQLTDLCQRRQFNKMTQPLPFANTLGHSVCCNPLAFRFLNISRLWYSKSAFRGLLLTYILLFFIGTKVMSKSDKEHDTNFRLEDILVFVTWADCVPPMGFKMASKIHFS